MKGIQGFLNIETLTQKNLPFRFLLILSFVLGAFLRLYLILDQVILDDEWHGIDFTINNSFWYLLTHFTQAGATCIPLNLYRRLLLNTFGLSELLLVLPSLVAGLLSLIVFPALVRKEFNKTVTVLFSFLLAISPFLIFYSRVARPYSIFTLLGFLSVLSLYFWASTGQKKWACVFIISGTLGIYFHLFAVIPVLVPIGIVYSFKILQLKSNYLKDRVTIKPGFYELFLVLSSIVLLTCVLLLPAIFQRVPGMPFNEAKMTAESFLESASLVAGTSNKMMVFAFWGLFGLGNVVLIKRRPLLGLIFISLFIFYFLSLIISKPDAVHIPIVIVRYVIYSLPVCFLLVSLAVDEALSKVKSIYFFKKYISNNLTVSLLSAAFILLFLIKGPLKDSYFYPNNFTNHSAFNESYKSHKWENLRISNMFPLKSYIGHSNVSLFYKQLANMKNIEKIIEYPMMVGNSFNPYYYYQYFHMKKVIIGYATILILKDAQSKGFVGGNWYIDEILSKITDEEKLKFVNMVNVMKIGAVKKSGAEYIIMHKYVLAELFPQIARDKAHTYPIINHMKTIYQKAFGEAVFEDKDLIVYRIDKTP